MKLRENITKTVAAQIDFAKIKTNFFIKQNFFKKYWMHLQLFV